MPISRERLSQGGHWLASSSLWSLKNVSRSPLFPCQDPWFDSFFLLLNFLSSPHIYSLYFPFFWVLLGYENIPRKRKKKVLIIKVPFIEKFLHARKRVSSTIQNWIRQKRQRELFSYHWKTPTSTWKPIEQKSCSVNDKSAL